MAKNWQNWGLLILFWPSHKNLYKEVSIFFWFRCEASRNLSGHDGVRVYVCMCVCMCVCVCVCIGWVKTCRLMDHCHYKTDNWTDKYIKNLQLWQRRIHKEMLGLGSTWLARECLSEKQLRKSEYLFALCRIGNKVLVNNLPCSLLYYKIKLY